MFSESTLERFLVKTLCPNLFDQYCQGAIPKSDLNAIASAVSNISQRYLLRQGTDTKAVQLLTTPEAVAYALYYLPINAAKVARVISELECYLNSDTISVLDYGAGPATASIALAAALPERALYCDQFDRDPAMLGIARKLSAALQTSQANFTARQISDPKLIGTGYDLIVLANFINEISDQQVHEEIQKLTGKLATNGVLVILEPGSKDITRRLMLTRNMILSQTKELNVIYPCLHDEPCWMLEKSRDDWCHTELDWQRPQLVRQIDQLTGFNKHKIKFSVVAFSRQKRRSTNHNSVRLITAPRRTKRGLQMVVCSKNLAGEITLPKGKFSTATARAKQYSAVDLSELPNKNSQNS